MRRCCALLVLLAAPPALHAQATITFTYKNAALTPPAFTMVLHRDGSGLYEPEGAPQQAMTLRGPLLSDLFAAAQRYHLFATTCQAHSRVAYSGDKTLAYAGPDGSGSCTFNNTKDGRLEELTGQLLAVASTMDEGAVLERDLAHDRLGLDGVLQQLTQDQEEGRALDMQNIAMVLEAIAADPRVLNHSRSLAQALLSRQLRPGFTGSHPLCRRIECGSGLMHAAASRRANGGSTMPMHASWGSLRWALLGAVLAFPVFPAEAQSASQPPDQISPSFSPSELAGALPARLSDVEGTVRVAAAAPAQPASANPGNTPAPPPDAVYDPAQANMPLLPGAALETGQDGRAEVQFNDGAVARITPDSGLGVIGETGQGEELRALSGLTYYELSGSTTGQLTVQMGLFTLTPSLNSLIRVDMDTAPYQVAALRGTVQLDDPNAGVVFTLDEGQSATVNPSDPTSYSVSQQIAANSWDQWNADRDSTLAEMAEGETTARENSANSDADAWNDLDYYGTWYDMPGAGEAWAPDGVDADFDPYGDGGWAYYNDLGDIWISAYPWGWLPYHCGSWGYFGGFGWMWQPGSGCGVYGRGWYPYSGIHHAPPNYRLPRYGGTVNQRLHARITGVPIGPVHPVTRGSQYRFRAIGGARPEPRQLALPAKDQVEGGPSYARTLPVVQMPSQYRGPGFAGGVRPLYVPQPGTRGSVISPTPRAISPTPRAISPTPRVYSPAPRVEAPAPRAEPAPHESAPSRPH